jgi:hypothetical protein
MGGPQSDGEVAARFVHAMMAPSSTKRLAITTRCHPEVSAERAAEGFRFFNRAYIPKLFPSFCSWWHRLQPVSDAAGRDRFGYN